MSHENLEEIEIPNPEGRSWGAAKTIKVLGVRISEREMIQKVTLPQGSERYSHQYLDGGKAWTACRSCGDVLGVPEMGRGGPLPSIEAVEKYCSRYGKY